MKIQFISLTTCFLFSCFFIFAQPNTPSCGFELSPERSRVMKNQQSDQSKIFRLLGGLDKENRPKVNRVFKDDDDLFTYQLGNSSNQTIKLIPIAAHIIRRSDETGGITKTEIEDAIKIVNEKFKPTNFVFQLCSTAYLDSTLLYTNFYAGGLVDKDTNPLTPVSYDLLDVENRNVARMINIYFFPFGKTSWSYGVNARPFKQHLMIRNDHVATDIVMAHELAHWFDLVHTHYNFDSITDKELVKRTNCFIAGDFLCDTPADPSLTDRVDSNCQYIQDPTVVDANGDTYTPDPTNIMSYATRSCRIGFSNGQITRMLAAYFSMQNDRGYTLSPCMTFSMSSGSN